MKARRIELVASWDLARELTETLLYPKLRRYAIDERDVEDVLILLAPTLPHIEIDVPLLRDPDDAPVIAAAVAGAADAIVTGERGLLDDDELRRWLLERKIELSTPADLLSRLR